jgi:tRNA-specific 2-thiouridylase
MGLPVFDKPDSQEICFVPDNDYAGLVERRRPELSVEGRIIDRDGNQLGTHAGQHKFTIGQRRGVGVALGHPIYVVEKRPDTNEVVVGGPDDLLATTCEVHESNWLIDPPAPDTWIRVLAQHRYNAQAVPARVQIPDATVTYQLAPNASEGMVSGHPQLAPNASEGMVPRPASPTPSGRPGRFRLVFDAPERAVTPGQAVVLYDASDNTLVLGGGWIGSVSAV